IVYDIRSKSGETITVRVFPHPDGTMELKGIGKEYKEYTESSDIDSFFSRKDINPRVHSLNKRQATFILACIFDTPFLILIILTGKRYLKNRKIAKIVSIRD
ncbi:MAG: hypothetical protein AAB116_19585, partial [Candidatus Poribacteria bacterium]